MGGNSSSHHVSFEGSDEEGVTFLKGIRTMDQVVRETKTNVKVLQMTTSIFLDLLSERVIDRMKESPRVASTKSTKQTTTPSEAPTCLVPDEQHVPIIPHPPSYVSTLVPPPLSEPVTPVAEETSTPPSPVESPESFLATPPTGQEHVIVFPAVPEPQPVDLPAEPINVPSPMLSDPITTPQLVEPSNTPVEPLTPPPVITSTTEPEAIPPSPTTDPLTEPLPSSDEPVVLLAEPIELLETPSFTSSAAEITSADLPVDLENSAFPASIPDANPSVSVEEPVLPSFIDQAVNEEELRKQIREDLQMLLNEEMKMEERNVRQQLEEEKAKAKAQAQAAAQLQIQEEVQKLLVKEKATYQQILADAIKKEQLSAQDENLITQYYWMERKAQKLKEKEKDLENQDALFQQQIAKMQEKMAQFSKVTAESHKKGFEDAHNRFRRYQIKPVCSDLQRQILKCYAENKGQTMSCSHIASQYIQCVDRAKQDKKLSTGG